MISQILKKMKDKYNQEMQGIEGRRRFLKLAGLGIGIALCGSMFCFRDKLVKPLSEIIAPPVDSERIYKVPSFRVNIFSDSWLVENPDYLEKEHKKIIRSYGGSIETSLVFPYHSNVKVRDNQNDNWVDATFRNLKGLDTYVALFPRVVGKNSYSFSGTFPDGDKTIEVVSNPIFLGDTDLLDLILRGDKPQFGVDVGDLKYEVILKDYKNGVPEKCHVIQKVDIKTIKFGVSYYIRGLESLNPRATKKIISDFWINKDKYERGIKGFNDFMRNYKNRDSKQPNFLKNKLEQFVV